MVSILVSKMAISNSIGTNQCSRGQITPNISQDTLCIVDWVHIWSIQLVLSWRSAGGPKCHDDASCRSQTLLALEEERRQYKTKKHLIDKLKSFELSIVFISL